MFWAQHLDEPGLWTRKDLLLAEAIRWYERGLCSGCGMPAQFAYDPMNAGEFEYHDDVTCLGCEARERDESRPQPGEKRYLRNLMGT